jgi:geranylgeranyl pyrophosphate synthase
MVATGRQFKVTPLIRVRLDNEGFREMRKAARLEAFLVARGETWVNRLNLELAAAQRARKQKVEDGYTYHIHKGGTRLRLYIVAFTARAQAHERKHSSILKLMETTKYDVKTRAALAKIQVRKVAAAKAAETRKRNRAIARLEYHASGSS